MLLKFSVKNYLSFKDETGFSMEANKKIRNLSENKNIIKLKDGENIWLNKTAVFYGANASGKTNIFRGLDFLRFITLNSSGFKGKGIKEELYPNIFFENFLLDEVGKKDYSEFEIEFLLDKIKYKYSLKLNENEIVKEKLSLFTKNKEKTILNRQITKWEIEEEYFGFKKDDLEKLNLFPRNNQTFLSIFASRETGEYKFTNDNRIIKRKKNIGLASKINNFFNEIHFITSKGNYINFTMKMLKNEEFKNVILSFMNNADLNIKDMKLEEKELEIQEKNDFGFEINGQKIQPKKIINQKLNFIHPIFKEGIQIGDMSFDFLKQESQGTQALFSFLGPILDTIKKNGILLIDEIDTHMHFLLVENLIKFFQGKNNEGKNNIGESQFIFNTHNLDLMDLELFKKDQIYFTSKDNYGATEIYSLDNFKEIQIRNNSDIKKAYKFGLFGAVPILYDFSL